MPTLIPAWLTAITLVQGLAAPGLPVSPVLRAQAEPEPLAPVRPRSRPPAKVPAAAGPVPDAPPPPAPTRLSMVVRGAYRLPPASRQVPPAFGFAFAVAGEHRYGKAWGHVLLSLGIDFSFNLHHKDATGTALLDGVETTFDSERIIMDNQFVFLHTFAIQSGPWRPFAAMGAGLALGFFYSDEKSLAPGEQRPLRPMARAGIGIDRDYGDDAYFGVRVDYSRMLSSPALQTTSGARLTIFGDLLTFGFVIGNRFH